MKNHYNDIARLYPAFQPKIIFDVGANVGQSVLRMCEAFPSASIFCFEPVPETFQVLEKAIGQRSNVRCFNMALGEADASAFMSMNGTSPGNRILDERERTKSKARVDEVTVANGIAVAKAHDVHHIDFLKIDTEGYDLNVLSGFLEMLSNQDIDFIQIETSFGGLNKRHVPIFKILEVLEPFGYRVAQIYGQTFEKTLPILRRFDALLISEKTAQRFMPPPA